MTVVRRGSAVAVLAGAAWLGAGGAAWAQDPSPEATLAPDDPVISEQAVPTPAPGCEQDPTICASSLPLTGPRERLLATAAGGAALVLAGAGAVVAGRRRTAV